MDYHALHTQALHAWYTVHINTLIDAPTVHAWPMVVVNSWVICVLYVGYFDMVLICIVLWFWCIVHGYVTLPLYLFSLVLWLFVSFELVYGLLCQ